MKVDDITLCVCGSPVKWVQFFLNKLPVSAFAVSRPPISADQQSAGFRPVADGLTGPELVTEPQLTSAFVSGCSLSWLLNERRGNEPLLIPLCFCHHRRLPVERSRPPRFSNTSHKRGRAKAGLHAVTSTTQQVSPAQEDCG